MRMEMKQYSRDLMNYCKGMGSHFNVMACCTVYVPVQCCASYAVRGFQCMRLPSNFIMKRRTMKVRKKAAYVSHSLLRNVAKRTCCKQVPYTSNSFKYRSNSN